MDISAVLTYVGHILYIFLKVACFFVDCITGQLLRMSDRIGRSYVTQGDRKIRNLSPPLTPCQCSGEENQRGPTFSWLYLSRAGIVFYWLERAAHSQSEWRRPIPLRWWNWTEWGYVTINFWLIFAYSLFSYRNLHFIKKCLKTKR